MQAPIPDDWINEAWLCYAIQWPDSTKWLAILNGLLSNPRQGRFWNGQTGIIRDAQAIGAEIWYRNQPLVPCADSQDCDEQATPEIVYLYCSPGEDEEDEDMSGCSSPTPPIKIENGILYYWHCCQWVQIGLLATLAQQGSELDEDAFIPPEGPIPDPPLEVTACAQATAIVEFVAQVANSIWDAKSDPLAILNVQKEVGANLNDKWLISAVVKALEFVALSGGWTGSPTGYNLYDAWEQQDIKASIATRLGDTIGVPDDATFESIKWAYIDEMLIDLPRRFFWSHVLNAIGRGLLNDIAIAGGTQAGTDCSAPAAQPSLFEGYATGADWRYVFDFRVAQPAYVELGSGTLQAIGEGLWSDCGPTQNNNEVGVKVHLDQLNNGSVLTNIGILYRTRGDEDYNNGSGCKWSAEDTDHLTATDMEAASGTTPAQAGVWTITKVVNDPLGAAEDVFDVGVAVYHAGAQLDDLIENSVVILAIFAAGTGPGPLSAPPT